ncbi:MAG: methionine--tRNA ligase [Cytophagales bacterium]|nr:MAG: methionine--tRNA ligase [Cytophagales bacterium]TAF59334.1 MAG: methionine--tRNA ligase [Cytophagales bacterium]
MSQAKRYTITAALPYANGPVHIGHLAGAYIPADVFARYQRLRKREVLFVCGSDEHGAAITIRAKKEGISPQQIIDKYHSLIENSFSQFGISFDIYHRTSAELHHQTSQEFFKTLHEKGVFVERESEQFFDEPHQQFLADRYITGTCPKCGHDAAYGDQCEKCGTSLSPTELINPKSTLSGEVPVLKKTKHWYLPMDQYQEWLKWWIVNEQRDSLKANVYGQCRSWLEQGLQERAMTRDLDWGVKVPLPNAEGKVLYVWLDAPIGYISATKAWALKHDKRWEDYWQKPDTELVHFIGKDNIVFHCIIFPIILKAHGKYILPKNVPANEFLNLEGNKISTSRNWAVWLHEYMQDFAGKNDVLRYVLLSIAPETKDSEFTWKDFQTRNNSELVATLGNFVNRTVVLTNKYFEGFVPPAGEFTNLENQVLSALSLQKQKIEQLIEHYKFRDALYELMEIARIGNKYLADTEPWKLFKQDPELVKTILNVALQISANLAILMQPFLPETAQKLAKMLNITGLLEWENAGKTALLKNPHQIGKEELLFSKIEDTEIEAQIAKLNASKKTNEAAHLVETAQNATLKPAKNTVTFDQFAGMDIRIATIKAAQKVPKTQKLLQITLDTGLDERTVVSGIAEFFEPESLVGKQVCFLANLAPRAIKGINSQGMILMAESPSGELHLLAPQTILPSGSVVG